jgi:hypothetical protein
MPWCAMNKFEKQKQQQAPNNPPAIPSQKNNKKSIDAQH